MTHSEISIVHAKTLEHTCASEEVCTDILVQLQLVHMKMVYYNTIIDQLQNQLNTTQQKVIQIQDLIQGNLSFGQLLEKFKESKQLCQWLDIANYKFQEISK